MSAVRMRRSDGREKVYRGARFLSWLFSVLVTAAVLCFLFLVWLVPTRIVGDSMQPALNDGEIVLCDRLSKYWKSPERGDMVLFETADGVFIKRVTAFAGETVEMIGGNVFIDSRPLDDSVYASEYVGDLDPLVVPENTVFVLGDNRAQIYDSRLPSVGCLSTEQILGVLRLRVYPFLRFTYFS